MSVVGPLQGPLPSIMRLRRQTLIEMWSAWVERHLILDHMRKLAAVEIYRN